MFGVKNGSSKNIFLNTIIQKIDKRFHFKSVFKMEIVKIEFELSGQTTLVSEDTNNLIVFEQKLDRRGNFVPIENGVYAFFFSTDKPVKVIEMLWKEFEFIYEALVKNGYKPCFFDYPQWFEKYDHHYKKYQFVY
jgi:hypothetical protein